MPIPAGVGERRDEKEKRGTESAERPLGARLERGLREQDERGRGEDDPVRDDPVRDVRGRDRHQHGAEERRHDRLAGEAERDEAGRDKACSRELDRRVEPADAHATRAAAAAQHQVRDDGDVVVPGQLGTAAHAG
jgi:hypothetical protein